MCNRKMSLRSRLQKWQGIMPIGIVTVACIMAVGGTDTLFHFEKKQYASSVVESVAGQSAQLPCNMTVPENDTVYLVLWFKEGLTTPIYSYDVRELLSGEPKHWWDADLLGSRAFFNAHSNPAHLLLRHVTPVDAGQYKCRVDFQREPTRNSRVNLTVVVPPRDVVILDRSGKEVRSFIGPNSEGDSLQLSCITYGGIPPPSVVWLINGEMFDDQIDSTSKGEVRNDLSIERVTRNHLRAELTCRASYRQAYPPFLTTATLDMNLEPLDVRIHPPPEPVSAGRTYEIICSSRGSRPPAVLTWWKGDTRIPTILDQTSPDGNISRSVIKVMINASDNGKQFSCRAENKKILSAVIEDTLKINVYYLPIVTVKFGPSLDPKGIKEGDDVYFECSVDANPVVYKVLWKHNDKFVDQDKDSGVLLSNRSLVLQDVTRSHSGRYTCVASNVEGDGESRPVILNIQYPPVCKKSQTTVFGVSTMERTHVTCQVDAVPQVTKFRWWFNNTAETLEVPEGRFTVGFGGRSVVTYTPTSDLDYGTLLCSAENTVGVQEVPCLYHIIPTSPPARPEAPTNCSIYNISADSLKVTCSEGFDGGLNQSFVMEVYTTQPHTLHVNISASTPRFQVSGLESDSEIQLIIYAGNAKGRSGITRLVSYTLKPPVKQLETRLGTGEKAVSVSDLASAMPSIVGALAGGILVIVIIGIIVIISIRRKCWRRNADTDDSANGSSESSQTQFSIAPKFVNESFTTKYCDTQHPTPPKQPICHRHQPPLFQESALCNEQRQQHLQQDQQQQQKQQHPQLHQYPVPINFGPTDTCLTEIPPPPSQYASESFSRELTRSFHGKGLSPMLSTPPSSDLINNSNEGKDTSCYEHRERGPNLPDAQQFHMIPWPSESGVSSVSSPGPNESQVPLVYVADSSTPHQQCSSIAVHSTIAENRENASGSPASRRESSL